MDTKWGATHAHIAFINADPAQPGAEGLNWLWFFMNEPTARCSKLQTDKRELYNTMIMAFTRAEVEQISQNAGKYLHCALSIRLAYTGHD